MPAPALHLSSYLPRLATALAVPVLLAGCVTAAGAGTSAPTTPANSTAPSQPAGTAAPAQSFYLRAWQSQALAPQYTFSWLPQVTIADGIFIDGMVAVPAIYPGPLWVQPSASTISQAGIDAIVAEARKQGLLNGSADLTSSLLMGGVTAHLEMIVNGQTYEVTGDPAALSRCMCSPEPGTATAFAAFWQKLTSLSQWLPDALGPSAPYAPERIAVLAMPPDHPAAAAGITPDQVAWPLSVPFASFGTAMGNDTFRCAVVSGAELATLLPAVQQANQLTRFVDSAGTVDQLVVRVTLPGEPSPCA